jgi:hypothetical protein
MRAVRIVLLLVVVGAVAGIAVPNAKALGFEDTPCGLTATDGQLKVCKPNAQTGKAYTLQIPGKGGCTPDSVHYDLVGGSSLPPGLSLSSSSVATVSGVPTQAGSFRFWLQVTDIASWQGGASWCSDTKQSQWEFEITVVPGLQIQQRQSALTTGQLNTAYNLQLSATGGTGISWSVASGALPAGLTLNSGTGLLSGTPTAVGDYHFQIKVTDGSGSASDVQTYTMSVVEPLRIGKASGMGEVGRPLQLALAASGGKAPYKWAATNLPAGVTLDAASGTVSGTPTVAAAGHVNVTVTDSLGLTTSLSLSLPVVARLSLNHTPLTAAKVGRIYSFRLARVGGARPFTWSATGLPAGIKLNAKTGRLYGMAKKAGTYHVRVRVTDGLGAGASVSVVLKVSR